MRSAEGSIIELDKGKRYQIQINMGRNPKTGRRERCTKVVRGSRRKAEKAKREMLAKFGMLEAGEDQTLAEFWEEAYMPSCEERLRPITCEGYQKDYNALIKGRMIEREHLSCITPMMVDRWLGSLPESRRFAAHKLLRQALSRACKWRLIDYNPCKSVDTPKRREYSPDPLDAEDAGKYLEWFAEHGDETARKVILLALGGGFRRSEMAALDWRDITLGGTVTVRQAATAVKGGVHIDDPKSSFGFRSVHLPSFAVDGLNAMRPESGKGPVFAEADGSMMHPQKLSRAFERCRDQMPPGYAKRTTLKDLRHTSLTLVLEGGADILAVSRRAGHSSIAITSKYYVRPHESVDINAAEGLDMMVKKRPETA